jgi:hypothetical protein
MALSALQFTGGGNASISGTPQAFQVTGPTIIISNVGVETVYGSLGGSASTSLNPQSYISGQVQGGSGGGNTGVGFAGIAVLPGQTSPPISIGANSWIWLCTLGGARLSLVNIANGT